MSTTFDTDKFLHRLTERQTEHADDYGVGECWNCGATLTAADIEHGDCTACGSQTAEPDSEDLQDFNGWELGYDD
jgi:Zn finger protein HypA/HybF involved in hydrogenase expression